MPTFSNNPISTWFKRLFQIKQSSNTGVDGTVRNMETGDGAATSMWVSDDKFQVRPDDSDSTQAFMVANEAGSQILAVDTTNSKVLLGTSPINQQTKEFGIYELSPTAGYHYHSNNASAPVDHKIPSDNWIELGIDFTGVKLKLPVPHPTPPDPISDGILRSVHRFKHKDGGYKFKKGGTGSDDGPKDQYYSNNRDIAYVPGDQHSWWLYNELEKCVIEANVRMFQFDIHHVTDPLHYVIYPTPNQPDKTGQTRPEGGYLDWHMDIGFGGVNRRKLATTVQLSDPNDYEGGDFQVWYGGRENFITLPREKGDVLIMPTFYLHNITPITRGERRALVYWTGGEPFR